jgi:LmbE family N-acetylglucosaminyl deacetylase
MKDNNKLLYDYLQKHNIENITIISPHLDDAAFSLATFISTNNTHKLKVVTVFTKSDHADSHWSKAMGFSNPTEEFSARRIEDIEAMNTLGVSYTHAGFEVDSFYTHNAEEFMHSINKSLEQSLVLLPVGAGRRISSLERFCRRAFRVPTGCEAHSEHLLVRDVLCEVFSDRMLTIGFYAELPYQWANSVKSLQKLLINKFKKNYRVFSIKPEVEQKLSIAKCYSSQFEAEFGLKEYYQKRTLSRPELIFLPE